MRHTRLEGRARRAACPAPLAIQTPRLRIIAADVPHLDAELSSAHALGAMLDAVVPESWPPGVYDRDAVAFFRQHLRTGGAAARGWYVWYGIERGVAAFRDRLVASIGFFGPPSADACVEIGYSVIPERRGRGYATELVHALLAHAQAAGVTRVIAEARDDNEPSLRVLLRCGFVRTVEERAPGSRVYVRSLT